MTPAIEVRDLHKAFEGLKVLCGVDLVVERGTTLVLMGESGSGKTVLLKHLIGLMKPDRGQVLIDGVDIVPLGEAELEPIREKFGMVFQGSALFDGMSVFENVAFPLRQRFPDMPEAEVRRIVHEKLELFDLHEVDSQLPEELSGGMRKRVAVARAIVADPKIVLYDGPTAGLDPLTTESVTQSIIRARKAYGITSVVVSDDLASAFEMADQVAFLHGGRIIARGKEAELRASKDPEVHRFLALWEESVAATR